MTLRLSAIGGVLLLATLGAFVVLLPAPPSSIRLIASARSEPRIAAPIIATNGAPSALSADPVQARLGKLMWRHGKGPVERGAGSLTAAAQVAVSVSAKTTADIGPSPAAPIAPPTEAIKNRLSVVSGVYVHASPGGQGARLFTLRQGEIVEAMGTTSNWVQVMTASGTTGWVYSTFLTPTNSAKPGTY